jgi:hypothetical protein
VQHPYQGRCPAQLNQPTMYKILLTAILSIITTTLFAQKKVQTLQPARLGVFKNGTCFVKREGMVSVAEKSFYIKAPDKVLMGTYWVMTGKESSIHSIVIKTDTFKVTHAAKLIGDFLETSIGQNITLYGNAVNTELRKLSGKLLAYDKETMMLKMAVATGKTIITDSRSFDWFETGTSPNQTVLVDSIIPVAKVKLNKAVDNILASTISLERGTQWFPSYLFTIINEKEAKLELKATIANGETEYRNMPVDIIIGSPEMFYGNTLDPACIDYLSESLLENRYDNNGLTNNAVQFSNFNLASSYFSTGNTDAGKSYTWEDKEDQQKDGQKLEDLYYYQLGVLDLEKNSRTIVPVMSINLAYTEIYTVDIPLIAPSAEDEENLIQAYHSYLITNNSNAPLTTGAALVLNQNGQPLSQAQLTYTPVKGSSEMQLSKAIDVQVKNEEEESSRGKSTIKKTGSLYYEKVNTTGTVTITNYKDKKVKIRVTKLIGGTFSTASNNGKARKNRTANEVYWEVEIEAGAKLSLSYEYYLLK